jgi:hypothetical protein
MEVITFGDIVRGERVVEECASIETTVDVRSADFVEHRIEGDNALPHRPSTRGVVGVRGTRILEQRLADVERAPGQSRENIVLQDHPQPIDVWDAHDVDPCAR